MFASVSFGHSGSPQSLQNIIHLHGSLGTSNAISQEGDFSSDPQVEQSRYFLCSLLVLLVFVWVSFIISGFPFTVQKVASRLIEGTESSCSYIVTKMDRQVYCFASHNLGKIGRLLQEGHSA